MKRLTLVRHGKSDHPSALLKDFDRPLNTRGLENSSLMGQVLRDQGFSFDGICSSPAVRALTTATRICQSLGSPVTQIVSPPALYSFDSEDLYRFIESLDDHLAHAVLVGHNPGITLLVNDLCLTAINNMPTCGVARIELDIATWVEVRAGCGKLINFDSPKNHQP